MVVPFSSNARSPILVQTQPRADLLAYDLMSQALLSTDSDVEDAARFVRCAHAQVAPATRDDPDRFARAQFNGCMKELFPTVARGFLRTLITAVDAALPSLGSVGLLTNPLSVRGSVRATLPSLSLAEYRAAFEAICGASNAELAALVQRVTISGLAWTPRRR